MRLEFVRSPDQLRKKSDALQLVLSVDAAESLQQTLGAAINRIREAQYLSHH
jgi:hypothetical protein